MSERHDKQRYNLVVSITVIFHCYYQANDTTNVTEHCKYKLINIHRIILSLLVNNYHDKYDSFANKKYRKTYTHLLVNLSRLLTNDQ